jgi:hypothetical protein
MLNPNSIACVGRPRQRAVGITLIGRVGGRQGCEMGLNSHGNSGTQLASVASTDFSSKNRQLASVNTPMQIEQTRVGL